MLANYEKYLRKPRKITRLNQGKMRTRAVKGMNDAAIHNHFRDLRILFKAAMKFYNRPQYGEIKIPYCPFDNFKIVEAPETEMRNTDIQTFKAIRDCRVAPGSRAELAKELYVLSVYLCGANAADIYRWTTDNVVSGRINYNRQKTENRRKDRAFISINLIEEATPLLYKYLGRLSKRYCSFRGLDRAINEGMKVINRLLGTKGITFYWARHTFGNLARNKCRMSTSDVARALNHIEQGFKTTDIYLAKDWDIVDDVQQSVMKLIHESDDRQLRKITSTINPEKQRKTMRLITA